MFANLIFRAYKSDIHFFTEQFISNLFLFIFISSHIIFYFWLLPASDPFQDICPKARTLSGAALSPLLISDYD